jgi:hypothetical protein
MHKSAQRSSARKSSGSVLSGSMPLIMPLRSGEYTRPKITAMMASARSCGKKKITR